MNRKTKLFVLLAVGLYVLSPVDALPGPIDDMIVVVLTTLLPLLLPTPAKS